MKNNYSQTQFILVFPSWPTEAHLWYALPDIIYISETKSGFWWIFALKTQNLFCWAHLSRIWHLIVA